MKKIILALLAGSMILGLTGCTMRLTDFTVLSTKNIDLARVGSLERGKSRVEGDNISFIIIFIPTSLCQTAFADNCLKEAIDKAIESVPGAVALVDGVVYHKGWWFIFGQSGFVVQGTPLIDPTLASSQLKSNYIVSNLNDNGEIVSTQYVSKEEYIKLKDEIIKSE
ncbi:MAG: hypothetical protein C4581_01005 [Nitrospiraceae bacterium]|nr:MAG: hypothetical protein C4581_01005 [Nitrospiraceae bacterium]